MSLVVSSELELEPPESLLEAVSSEPAEVSLPVPALVPTLVDVGVVPTLVAVPVLVPAVPVPVSVSVPEPTLASSPGQPASTMKATEPSHHLSTFA
jgi:hypothetical protein